MALPHASISGERAQTASPIPVYVINESPIFVMALTDFLHETMEVLVIGSAVRLSDGLSAAQQARPEVVLLDPGPEANAIPQAIQAVRAALPSAGLMVLAAHEEEETRQAALAAGADAFISQWAPGDHLVGPIRDCVGRRKPS